MWPMATGTTKILNITPDNLNNKKSETELLATDPKQVRNLPDGN